MLQGTMVSQTKYKCVQQLLQLCETITQSQRWSGTCPRDRSGV